MNGSGSTLTISGSTISGNGASSPSQPDGGGLEADGTTTITDTDITNNTVIGAEGSGAGIVQLSGTLSLTRVNVTGNLASGQYSFGGASTAPNSPSTHRTSTATK